jgi:hypothetical protein
LVLAVDGAELPATLTMPAGEVRGAVVVLHGAEAGQRSYFLHEHLARLLAPEGVAGLRYDRRPSPGGDDVPLDTQAADALAALAHLRGIVPGVPTGLWGFSQGAWVAPLAAVAEPASVGFLVCVSGCGVSPAEQMRVGCARQLRKHGYSEADVAELTTVRLACERFLRSGEDQMVAQRMLQTAAARPWFEHAYLPRTLPQPGSWPDMDFDPGPALARLTCPVLAFYGETDEWMPIEESVAAWRAATEQGALIDLTVVRLPGADHLPTLGGQPDPAAISSRYSETLAGWVRSVCAASPPGLGRPG